MSEVSDMLKRYERIRAWFRQPPNAVPDTGIDLRRHRKDEPPVHTPPQAPDPIPPPPIAPPIILPTISLPSSAILTSVLVIAAREFNVHPQELMLRSNRPQMVVPRQIVMYIISKQKRWSTSWIGKQLKKDHTTVLHGIQRVEARIERDPYFRGIVQQIEDKFAALHPSAVTPVSEHNMAEGAQRENPPKPDLSRLDSES